MERLDANCCELVYDMSFRITGVSHTRLGPRAVFTVTHVRLGNPKFFNRQYPAPRAGQAGTLLLRQGVVTDTLTQGTYCNREAGNVGACGL